MAPPLFQYTLAGEGIFESKDRTYRVASDRLFWQRYQVSTDIITLRMPLNRGISSSCYSALISFMRIGKNLCARQVKLLLCPWILLPSVCCG